MSFNVRKLGRVMGCGLVAGAALACFAAAHPAFALSAGAVGLFAGSTLTVNGLTITVTGCSVHLGAAASTSCPSGGSPAYEILQSAGPGSTVKIQGVDGTAIFSNIAKSAFGSYYDLNVDLQISAALAKTTVDSVSASLSSTNVGGNSPTTAVSMVENGSGVSFSSLSLTGYGVTSDSRTFTAVHPLTNPFTVNKDIKLNSFFISGVDTVSINYVTQTFLPAPEPVSAALLLSGLAGLGYVRRRKLRNRK